MLTSSDDPVLRLGLDYLNEGGQLLVRDLDSVDLEEFNETSTVIDLLQVEVTVLREHESHVFTR